MIARYAYRKDGRLSQQTLANGIKTLKLYDPVGRLEKVMHLHPGGTELWSETSRYDQRDRRTARVHTEGTADLFAYDPAGQLIAAAYGQAQGSAGVPPAANPNAPSAGGTPVPPFSPQQRFDYDPAGNRKEFQDIDGSKTGYQTNEANQYTGITREKGQATREKDGPASALSDLQVPAQPSYDANGNLLRDTRNTYTWDADIHMLSVETRGAGDSPAAKTEFRYDALHRRVARLESDGTLTHFVHDGWNVIAEYEGSTRAPRVSGGAPASAQVRAAKSTSPNTAPTPAPNEQEIKLATTLIWGHDLSGTAQGAGGIAGLLETKGIAAAPRSDNKPLSLNPSLLSLFFSYDSNGNVVVLTDAEGKESARYAYDAFGKTLTAQGPAAQSNKYRFSTKPLEESSGLAFYGFRYYSPELGRWTARDPIGEFGGSNLLLMAKNAPVVSIDILGLLCDPTCREKFEACVALVKDFAAEWQTSSLDIYKDDYWKIDDWVDSTVKLKCGNATDSSAMVYTTCVTALSEVLDPIKAVKVADAMARHAARLLAGDEITEREYRKCRSAYYSCLGLPQPP